MPKELVVKTSRRSEFVDLTGELDAYLGEIKAQSGLLTAFVPHTTAGVTINENADPAVHRDIIEFTASLIPKGGDRDVAFQHDEGNSDAHIKSSFFSPSLTVIVEDGKMCLGTWQSVYFTEFDGPRNRQCWVKTTCPP